MRRSIVLLLLLAAGSLCLIRPASVGAENWPAWRGPHGNGVVADAGYPVEWSEGQNILWAIDMPAHAGSTPIVWGDQIFLTVADHEKNLIQSYDWQGELKWQAEVGSVRDGKHRKASGTNPSPVTDGHHVFAYFKSGDLACFDLQGAPIWHINLQREHTRDALLWDLGTSPVLTDDYVVVAVMHDGPSYLIALDKATGDLGWKVDRSVDAPRESNDSYTTPLVIEHDSGRGQMLVVMGADHLTAHNAADGKERWRVGGFNPDGQGNFRSIASPVYSDGVIVAPYARGNTLTAVSLDGEVLWRNEEISADVPTPVAVDGKVYLCTDKGRIACVDLKMGNELWGVETGRRRDVFSASPVLVGDRLYAAREDGTVFVVSTTGNHDVLATNQVEGFTLATPVFVQGKILVRTADHLYCIGRSDG
jgi:outer membrane protein assembly factor BamB